MGNRAGIHTARIGIGVLAVGALVGIGATFAPPPAGADATPVRVSEAEIALDALTGHGAAQAVIPAGFTEQYYVPAVEEGLLVNPGGGCSSPIPLPAEFDVPCKAHDLGYDMLRFGHSAEVTATARRELDARLSDRMHDSCTTRTGIGPRTACFVMAEIATAAVSFNSWRQHYGSPDPEPALPYLLAGGLGAGLAALVLPTLSITAPRTSREVTV
ncbi:hypothetical protein [Rhodococcoides yunnanense]|uniref:hypothetical protein n=1 Tax=Rhodococcoides yunnanense TaxID=278209 RepID=UPI00157DF2ED|nr:hypothetical protein [Rhodococcus yunnanensis]